MKPARNENRISFYLVNTWHTPHARGNVAHQLITPTTMLSVSALNRLSLVARHLERAFLLRSVEHQLRKSVNPSFSTLSALHQSRNMYRIEERGAPNSTDYRLFVRKFISNITTFDSMPYTVLILRTANG